MQLDKNRTAYILNIQKNQHGFLTNENAVFAQNDLKKTSPKIGHIFKTKMHSDVAAEILDKICNYSRFTTVMHKAIPWKHKTAWKSTQPINYECNYYDAFKDCNNEIILNCRSLDINVISIINKIDAFIIDNFIGNGIEGDSKTVRDKKWLKKEYEGKFLKDFDKNADLKLILNACFYKNDNGFVEQTHRAHKECTLRDLICVQMILASEDPKTIIDKVGKDAYEKIVGAPFNPFLADAILDTQKQINVISVEFEKKKAAIERQKVIEADKVRRSFESDFAKIDFEIEQLKVKRGHLYDERQSNIEKVEKPFDNELSLLTQEKNRKIKELTESIEQFK